MIRRKSVLLSAGLVGLGVMAFVAGRAVDAKWADPPAVPRVAEPVPPDAQKIDLPVNLDMSKNTIEVPTRGVLARTSAGDADATNLKVAPGLVKWHATFAAACEAARKSGKPVLLFQMMGKLDDQFC